jgi:hypothetical protein
VPGRKRIDTRAKLRASGEAAAREWEERAKTADRARADEGHDQRSAERFERATTVHIESPFATRARVTERSNVSAVPAIDAALVEDVAPTRATGSTQDLTPAPIAAPAKKRTGPRQRAAVANDAAPAIDAVLARESAYTRVPNAIFDDILGRLTPVEQVVYLRLYRLSHGYRQDTCTVSLAALGKASNASIRAVRYAVRRLEDLGLVERKGAEFAGPSDGRGNEFKVNAPAMQTAPASHAAPAKRASAAPDAANKHVEKTKGIKPAPVAVAPAPRSVRSESEQRGMAKAFVFERRREDPNITADELRALAGPWCEEQGVEVRFVDEAIRG